ncbi:MAG: hypothetical protein ACLSAF_10210 [Intestinimonas sp.]
MRNARNRALSLLCAGAILVSAIPVRASAAVSDAVEGTLIQGVEGSIRIDLGDASIDGTKTVRLSGYMEPIPDAYVEDGLVLRLDGLEGADAEAGTWTNLAGSRDPVYENNDIVYINRPEVDKVTGEGTNYFEGNGLVLDNSKVYLPACVAEAVNGDAYTVEYFVDSEGYSGNERAYSPLLTVDETADSWSIFTRTPGSTMELKQGANARLKVSFESAPGCPSARWCLTRPPGPQPGIWTAQLKARSTPPILLRPSRSSWGTAGRQQREARPGLPDGSQVLQRPGL